MHCVKSTSSNANLTFNSWQELSEYSKELADGHIAAGDCRYMIGSDNNALTWGLNDLSPIGTSSGYCIECFGMHLNGVDDDSEIINLFLQYISDKGIFNGANVGGAGHIKQGLVRLDDTVDLVDDIILDFGKTNFFLHAPIGFYFGRGEDRDQNAFIDGGRYYLNEVNQIGFSIENAFAPIFKNIDLNLYEAGQTGFQMKGQRNSDTGGAIGPYYGLIENARIFGNFTPGDGQTGMKFLGTGDDLGGSDGINRWTLSNIRHVAAMDYGLDIQAAHGLVFDKVHLEALYEWGVRFNGDAAFFEGTITEASTNPSVITDANYVNSNLFRSSAVEILTGANAGESANTFTQSDGQIILNYRMPYQFQVGDTYRITAAKAIDVDFNQTTIEQGRNSPSVGFKFDSGARNCRVHTTFQTYSNSAFWFTRDIEDMSNTIAEDYWTYDFEGTVPIGTNSVWLSPIHISSTRGGVALPDSGWLDGVFATGSTRGAGQAGEISVETYVSGQLESLIPKLTQDSPSLSRKIRKTLQNNQLIRPNEHIKVLAKGVDLSANESVRVQLHFGHST